MCLNLRFNILKPIGYVMNGVHSASWGQLRSYLNEKSSGSRSRKQRLTAVGTCCADHVTPLYPQKLVLTSPTGGGRSVGIVRVRTKATEFFFYWSRDAPTGLTFNNCTLCPHCIYVFCIYLRTNSDLCHLQPKLNGFYNRVEKYLQRGTDWVFK